MLLEAPVPPHDEEVVGADDRQQPPRRLARVDDAGAATRGDTGHRRPDEGPLASDRDLDELLASDHHAAVPHEAI